MYRIVRAAKNILLIVLGIFSAGLGLKGFLLSSRFIDGGVRLAEEVSGQFSLERLC